MRIVETLLGIVDMKRAEGLKLVIGEVPALLGAGGLAPLTMPALSPEMMEHVLADSFSPEEREQLRDTGHTDAIYRSSTYGDYAAHAQKLGDRLALTLRRGASGARKAAATPSRPRVSVAAEHHVELASEVQRTEPETASTSEPRGRTSSLDAILDEALGRGASDVILSAGRRPLMRIDGSLVECQEAGAIAGAILEAYVLERLGVERHETFERTGSADLSFDWAGTEGRRVRLRANAFRHDGGIAIALRPIATVPSLADLHLPMQLTQLLEPRTGLVLFTGPTGSGKSTTLAALLEHVNRSRAAHIITLEDPVEYIYQARRCIIHQREVGRHVDGFASGLRAALRENPDILLVGEMRDPETIRMALTAAQTGHLVLSTLHSGSTVMAIERIIDVFPESEKWHVRHELAASLRHIVAQRLVPAAGGGRLPALEILTMNHAIASQIRDGRTHMVTTQLETGASEGMLPMARSLASLVRSGQISRAAALSACDHRETLERLLG